MYGKSRLQLSVVINSVCSERGISQLYSHKESEQKATLIPSAC